MTPTETPKPVTLADITRAERQATAARSGVVIRTGLRAGAGNGRYTK